MRFTIIFLLFTSLIFAQKNRTDVGGGEIKNMKVVITILDKIEKSQAIDIKKYFLNQKDYNDKNWDEFINQIQKDFPNNDNSLPASDVRPSENLWYERTYFEELDNEIKYHVQIYFELEKVNNETKIKKVIFRKGKDIVNRDKEIKRLGDSSIPPPVPAIPGF